MPRSLAAAEDQHPWAKTVDLRGELSSLFVSSEGGQVKSLAQAKPLLSRARVRDTKCLVSSFLSVSIEGSVWNGSDSCCLESTYQAPGFLCLLLFNPHNPLRKVLFFPAHCARGKRRPEKLNHVSGVLQLFRGRARM